MSLLIVLTFVVVVIGLVIDWFERWFGGLRDELVRGMKIRNDLKQAQARLKEAKTDKAEAEAK